MSLMLDLEFKEGDHPRGQPDNPGQFAPAAGGSSSSNEGEGEKESAPKIEGTGNGRKPQPDFKGSLAHQTSGDTTQPVKSVDELYERARKEEPVFKDAMSDIAKQYNSEVQYTPAEYAEPGTILKSKSSAERKLKSELDNDPTLLRDVLRATIVSHSVEDTRKAAASFIGEHSDSILRVKDRYVDEMRGGYRDILINYRTPDGLVAEVQFNSKNMVSTKNGTAHKLYEKIRELPPGSGSAKTVTELEQQMSELYETAYLADGNSSWKKGGKLEQQQAHDAESGTVIRAYELSQEGGPSFKAAIVESGDGLQVISNRNGKWGNEEAIHYADLIMPEQALEDWEVKPLEPSELEDAVAQAAQDAAPVIKHRAIDRTFDIEYYTSETLGPRRERTPEGFLICYDVSVARVGEMVYAPGEVPSELGAGQDGRVRVTRSAAEVFSPRSMASLNGKPVTDNHPPVDVDPANWKFYTKGVVVNPRRGDDDQNDFLVADIIVFDRETIEDIEAGKREVSCGYNPNYLQLLDDQGNPIPGRGEQVKILYNHLALVPAGRCGPACAIGDQKTLDGVSFIVDDDTFWSQDRARRIERLARRFK